MSDVEALQGRLQVLDEEILRLCKLASESQDQTVQDNFWSLAQDLQREARQLRRQIGQQLQTLALASDRQRESKRKMGKQLVFTRSQCSSVSLGVNVEVIVKAHS